METSAPPPGPLTLPVSDIAHSTSFYLAALAPLGYGFISKVQHQTPTASSEAIGLGPVGSSRVDVFLSQSYRVDARRPTGVHVVFPAISRIAVRDFYTAALQAGGQPIARPDNLTSSDGMFASIVTDIDGNQIEVCFPDGVPPPDDGSVQEAAEEAPSAAGKSIEKWREDVVVSEPAKSTVSGTTAKQPPTGISFDSIKSAWSSAAPLKSAVSAAASHVSARRDSGASQAAGSTRGGSKSSFTSAPSVNIGGKAVVGSLIGAAAGAALAYSMVRSKQDSQEQEQDHRSRIRSKAAKAEARAYCDWVDRQQVNGKAEVNDRDSGYSSGSLREAPPTSYRHRNVTRSVTYPQPSTVVSSRGRSSSRKYIEQPPRNASPGSYYASPSCVHSVGDSSHSTMKPSKRSQSGASHQRSASSRRHISPLRLPEPPQPPSQPQPPSTRSRRHSMTSEVHQSLIYSSTGNKSKPPSVFSRAMGGDAPRSEALSLARSSSSRHSNRSARHFPLPPSEASTQLTARHVLLPPSEAHSRSTARHIPLPPSEAHSRSTARPPSSHRSASTARKVPLPPSEVATALTAKALSRKNKTQSLDTGSKLDDMGTVVPDDSISCASERQERRERESHASRRSHRSSQKSIAHVR